MGQRSQIYVRFTDKEGKKYLIARYFGWNYSERMVSRAKHSLEWINEMIQYPHVFTSEQIRLIRILEVNFDMGDVAITSDIIEEWNEYFPEENFSDYVFKWVDNNDGKLFIDIDENTMSIKYCFTDSDISKPLTAAQYMQWNHKQWRNSKYISKEQKQICEKNIRKIPKLAKLMTKEELDEFIICDYGYKSHPKPVDYDVNIYNVYDGNELVFITEYEHQALEMCCNINADGGNGYYTIQ